MNTYNPQTHHRRSIRLKGYDYAQSGAYFVTICTQGHVCLFGEVVDGEMQLNDAGRMVQTIWESMPARFPQATFDIYTIMPNHFHAIIVIDTHPVGATLVVAPNGTETRAGTSPAATGLTLNGAGTSPAPTDLTPNGHPTLGDMVGVFKSITTREYIVGVRTCGWPPFDRHVWQHNYHERIIRNDRELNAIRQYIADNPLQWALDRDNPIKGETYVN